LTQQVEPADDEMKWAPGLVFGVFQHRKDTRMRATDEDD
jgi:hypothetical protein